MRRKELLVKEHRAEDEWGDELYWELEMMHKILISRCKNVIVTVPSKCSLIQVNYSENVTVVFDSVVSQVEVLESKNVCLEQLGT